MQDFKKLMVWQESHKLTLQIYQITTTFPDNESYGLTGQLRRAVSSISANLAEGCGRETTVELKQFCFVAMGSASETEYHLLLAKDLNYLAEEDYARLLEHLVQVRKMLNSFIQKLNSSS